MPMIAIQDAHANVLNWLIAQKQGESIRWNDVEGVYFHHNRKEGRDHTWAPATDGSQFIQMIEEAGILVGPSPFPGACYAAGVGCEWDHCSHICTGKTALQALVCTYLTQAYGVETEVPDHVMSLVADVKKNTENNSSIAKKSIRP